MGLYPGRTIAASLLCACLSIAAPATATAQQDTYTPTGMILLGVHTAYDLTGKAPGVGMQLRLPLTAKLDLAPSGDLYFKDGTTYGQIILDLVAPFKAQGAGNYFGVGTAIVRSGAHGSVPNDTHIGPDFVFGVTTIHPTGTLLARPFFEVRWTIVTGPNPFTAVAGLNFRIF